MSTLSNVKTQEEEALSPSEKLKLLSIPSAKSSRTGVSVDYVHDLHKMWFVFRASYGREDRAFDIIVEDGTYAYIPKRYVDKIIGEKRKRFLESLIPNMLFVYTSESKAQEYMENSQLSFLSYYYNHFRHNEMQKNPPLIIPNQEMENFILATKSQSEHLLFVPPSRCHYKSGDLVVITEGIFKGVEGRVARVAGQQRVIVSISQLGLISTAYIPSAFIEPIKNQKDRTI